MNFHTVWYSTVRVVLPLQSQLCHDIYFSLPRSGRVGYARRQLLHHACPFPSLLLQYFPILSFLPTLSRYASSSSVRQFCDTSKLVYGNLGSEISGWPWWWHWRYGKEAARWQGDCEMLGGGGGGRAVWIVIQ